MFFVLTTTSSYPSGIGHTYVRVRTAVALRSRYALCIQTRHEVGAQPKGLSSPHGIRFSDTRVAAVRRHSCCAFRGVIGLVLAKRSTATQHPFHDIMRVRFKDVFDVSTAVLRPMNPFFFLSAKLTFSRWPEPTYTSIGDHIKHYLCDHITLNMRPRHTIG